MKKLIVLLFIVFGLVNLQAQNRKQTNANYENIFFKGSEVLVDRIVYSSQFDSAKSEAEYLITIYGKVKGSNQELCHYVKSTEGLEYYKEIFETNYKRIDIYNTKYKIGSKPHYRTSIRVSY
ncbi:hypothetical protein [Seonamhaeicola aphaedonensis]|nr:hypothetical protein [Seonamhaeicola aphaedonensis]